MIVTAVVVVLALFLLAATAVALHFPAKAEEATQKVRDKYHPTHLIQSGRDLKPFKYDSNLHGFEAQDEREAAEISSRLIQFEQAMREVEENPIEIDGLKTTVVVFPPANPADVSLDNVRAAGDYYAFRAVLSSTATYEKGLYVEQAEEQAKNSQGPGWGERIILGMIAKGLIDLEKWFGIKDVTTLVFDSNNNSILTSISNILNTFFSNMRGAVAAAGAVAIGWSALKIAMARERNSPTEIELALEGFYKTLGVVVILTLLPEILKLVEILTNSLIGIVSMLIKSVAKVDPKEATFHQILFGKSLTDPQAAVLVSDLAQRGLAFLIVLLVLVVFDIAFTFMYTVRYIRIVYMIILFPFRLINFLIFPEKVDDLRSFIGEFLGTVMLPFVHAVGLFAFYIIWGNSNLNTPTTGLLFIIISLAALMKFGSDASKMLGNYLSGASSLSRHGESFAHTAANVAGQAAAGAVGVGLGMAVGGAGKLLQTGSAALAKRMGLEIPNLAGGGPGGPVGSVPNLANVGGNGESAASASTASTTAPPGGGEGVASSQPQRPFVHRLKSLPENAVRFAVGRALPATASAFQEKLAPAIVAGAKASAHHAVTSAFGEPQDFVDVFRYHHRAEILKQQKKQQQLRLQSHVPRFTANRSNSETT